MEEKVEYKSEGRKIVFVTGGSGLVGSHLIKALIEKGFSVRAIYRNKIPFGENQKNLQWIKGDILDITSLEDAMKEVDKVYHCAAIVSFNPKEKKLLHKTNVEGTANVVNAALVNDVKKLCYVSSVAALGRIRKNEVITENMQWSESTSNSEYGKSKFFAEMEVWRAIAEGLNAVIVNPSIILGASDWDSGSSALFKNAYNEFPWFTDGVTGFVDVLDVVNAMIGLMESDISGERFILSGDNVSYREFFTLIAKTFHKKPPHKKVTPFLAGLIWRAEAVKAIFTGKKPILTKETSNTAQAKVYYSTDKLSQYLPDFSFYPIQESIERIAGELKEKYKLQ